MLGQLVIKHAAVHGGQGMAMPSMNAALDLPRTDARAFKDYSNTGLTSTDLKGLVRMLVGRPDLEGQRIELLKRMQQQPMKRTPIPEWASHRDEHGNFYVQDESGQFARVATDPATGQMQQYPVDPEIMARGPSTTTGLQISEMATPEKALGLTNVAKARAAGAKFIDQLGQFYKSDQPELVPMDQADPDMAENYRRNGQQPPMVDTSRSTTKERWRADPANAQAVANADQREQRKTNPAYVAKTREMYQRQGLPSSEWPSWLKPKENEVLQPPELSDAEVQNATNWANTRRETHEALRAAGGPTATAQALNPGPLPATTAAVTAPPVSPTPATTTAVAPAAPTQPEPAVAPPPALAATSTAIKPPTFKPPTTVPGPKGVRTGVGPFGK